MVYRARYTKSQWTRGGAKVSNAANHNPASQCNICMSLSQYPQLWGAETTFPVPQASPGETVEVTAVLPTHGRTHGRPAGSHVGVYRLRDADGEAFLGDLLWCKLTVMP